MGSFSTAHLGLYPNTQARLQQFNLNRSPLDFLQTKPESPETSAVLAAPSQDTAQFSTASTPNTPKKAHSKWRQLGQKILHPKKKTADETTAPKGFKRVFAAMKRKDKENLTQKP